MFQDFINLIKSRKIAWVTIGIFLLVLMVYSAFFQKPLEQTATSNTSNTIGTTTVSSPNSNIGAANQPNTPAAGSTNAGASSNTPLTQFEEGKHYKKLPEIITNNQIVKDHIAETPGQIQVIEFFNYGCFWCHQVHPLLNEWVKTKPTTVAFYRYPVIFNKQWDALARTYLVVKKLEKNEALDLIFFSEIHQKKVNLADEKLLRAFLTEHNIPVEPFFEMYNSFAINSEMAKVNDIANAYQITLSPSIVVNTPSGSYFATATMVGTEKNLISLIDFLIKKENNEKK